jgi:hypothetical protein
MFFAIRRNQHHRLGADGLDDWHFRTENATPCAHRDRSSPAADANWRLPPLLHVVVTDLLNW